MKNGKKSVASQLVYKSFELIKRRLGIVDPFVIFRKALNHIRPLVEVKSRRVGGAMYQVPVEIGVRRSTTLALRWLILFSKKRVGKDFSEKLANEIIDAADDTGIVGKSIGKGGAVKKREDTHRMAEANKAFSHYNF
jgi:small subunit ribosomal protein S7